MLIGTILAILNAVSLIFKDVLLLSWKWVILAYVIETGFYILLWIIIILIGWIITR